MTEGVIGEWQAQVIAAETAGLAPHSRAIADQRLAGLAPALSGRGTARAARRMVAELDPAVVIARMEAAVAGRRVTVRPAPDGMAYLSVLAPLPEVVGAYGSLYRHATSVLAGTCPGETPQGAPRNGSDAADPSGTTQSTTRGRGAIMADALLRWASGRTPGQPQPIEVHVVMTDRALLGTGDPTRSVEEPALVPGHGPVPAAVARAWLLAGVSPTGPSRTGRRRRPRPAVPTTQPSGETRPLRTQEPAGADEPCQAPDPAETQQARVFLRRLYTTPDGRDLVAVDSRRRVFTGGLRQFLVLRDQSCRTPFCDAPITAGEHVHPHADGGRTDATNGMGGCVRCNLVKQAPGWGCAVVTGAQSSAPHPGTTRHTVILTTPTGHEHLSTAPPVLGWGWAPADVRSPLERRLTELLGAA